MKLQGRRIWRFPSCLLMPLAGNRGLTSCSMRSRTRRSVLHRFACFARRERCKEELDQDRFFSLFKSLPGRVWLDLGTIDASSGTNLGPFAGRVKRSRALVDSGQVDGSLQALAKRKCTVVQGTWVFADPAWLLVGGEIGNSRT